MPSEDFEVGGAVSEESFYVIMGTFEVFGFVHQEGFYFTDGQESVMGIHARRSMRWGSFIVVGSRKGVSICMQPGASEQVASWFLSLPQVLDLLFQAIGFLAHLFIQVARLLEALGVGGIAWSRLSSSFHLVITSHDHPARSFPLIAPLSS